MQTEICGHADVHALLDEDPRNRDLILITNPGYVPFGDEVLRLARRVLHLQFDDIAATFPDMHPPTSADVQRALDWAAGSEDLVVACHAGISRSSALAYVIRSRDWSPSQAVQILTRGLHSPNRLIVDLGAKLLGNPLVWSTYESWRNLPRH